MRRYIPLLATATVVLAFPPARLLAITHPTMTVPERQLLGVVLGRGHMEVLRRFHNPQEIQNVVMDTGAEQLPSLAGGRSGGSAGGYPGYPGGSYPGGGSGSGSSSAPLFGGGNPFGGYPSGGGYPGSIPALPPISNGADGDGVGSRSKGRRTATRCSGSTSDPAISGWSS